MPWLQFVHLSNDGRERQAFNKAASSGTKSLSVGMAASDRHGFFVMSTGRPKMEMKFVPSVRLYTGRVVSDATIADWKAFYDGRHVAGAAIGMGVSRRVGGKAPAVTAPHQVKYRQTVTKLCG